MSKLRKKEYKSLTQLTTKNLFDTLNCVFKEISASYNDFLPSFRKQWGTIIGEDLVKMTQIMGVKENTIVIAVSNSSLYSLLYHHKKQEILVYIRTRYSQWKIRDIVFRLI